MSKVLGCCTVGRRLRLSFPWCVGDDEGWDVEFRELDKVDRFVGEPVNGAVVCSCCGDCCWQAWWFGLGEPAVDDVLMPFELELINVVIAAAVAADCCWGCCGSCAVGSCC